MTTKNTDLGARTPEAKAISDTSREIARDIVGDESVEDRVRQRCVIATGDPDFKDMLKFKNDPVEAGLKALDEKAQIYVDINMVKVGVTNRGHNSPVHCALDFGRDLAVERGITRTSAGFRSLDEALNGSIVVVGNAPSAALALGELMDDGVEPALVVATPVGFVSAAESKQAIRAHEVPSITCTGTRGGSPVAISIMNEIISIYYERAGL